MKPLSEIGWLIGIYPNCLVSRLLSGLVLVLGLQNGNASVDSRQVAVDRVPFTHYPGSSLIETVPPAASETHDLIFGSLKKVNNVLTPEASRQVTGLKSQMLYLIPQGRSSQAVYEHYLKQVQQKAQVLFTCIARDCGSSSYWANKVFRKAMLYGPEKYQHLIVASYGTSDQTDFISIYTLRRGNRKVYAYIEVIESDGMIEIGHVAEMQRRLVQDGVLQLPELRFNAQGQMLEAAWAVEQIAELLKVESGVKVYIVGHGAGEFGFDRARETGQHNAESLRDMLTATGIDKARLIPESVGALAPLPGTAASRLELVLIR